MTAYPLAAPAEQAGGAGAGGPAARSRPPLARAARATALRVAVVAMGAVTLSAVRLDRPPTLCLLRAATGVPCPLCGSTTALVRAGRGDVAGAVLANPLALALLAALVLAPLLSGRVHVPHRARPWLFTGVAALAWSWQLVRFDRVPF